MNRAAAIEQLRRAIYVEGPRPDVHREALRKLRRDWPTLYDAVMRVVGSEERT